MDSVGSLVDKLATVGFKMFNEQEKLYDIRRMSFEQFYATYSAKEEMKKLHDYFLKAADLNVQRNAYIDEIDKKIVEIVTAGIKGENLDDGRFIQRKWKTL
jgi:hypothetical protein